MFRSGPGNALLDCPSREVLSEFSRGRLSDQDYDSVASHVSSCPLCGDVLRELHELSTDDSLVADLKACFDGQPFPDGLLETVSATAPLSGRRRAADEVLGKTIGQYRVEERIGWGGMGVVYRARQLPLNRDVALKMISAGRHASPNQVARFRREVEAVARLKSPNVVQVHETGEHDGLPYFSMELAEGGSLKDTLRLKGPLAPREAAALVRTLALAVHSAHEANVVHRDLKPGNILFAADGTPKVADFGLAKLVDSDSDDAAGLTTGDAMLGTAPYMAPEQAAARTGEVGKRTDVYALGAILYETLTGRPPFDADSKLRTLELVRSTDPEPPSRRRPEVPYWLESICLKCLEKSPARRYESARALADDLDRWLRDERPPGAPGRLVRSGRALRRYAAAAVLGLAVIAAGAAAYLNSADRALRNIESALSRGRPADLISKTGAPRWSRETVGRAVTQVVHDRDDAFTVQSATLDLLELLPDPQTDRYRFSAQVCHDEGDVTGQAGLYFGHKTYRSGVREIHYFVHAAFNGVWWQDAENRRAMLPEIVAAGPLPPTPSANRPELRAQILCDRPDRLAFERRRWLAFGPRFIPPGPQNGIWHDLEVEVTPDRVTARWDGQPFSVTTAAIRKATAQWLTCTPPPEPGAPPREVRPEYDPRGGLGLYLLKGVASFRAVRVTPLPR